MQKNTDELAGGVGYIGLVQQKQTKNKHKNHESSCCHTPEDVGDSCHPHSGGPDYLLYGSLVVIALAFIYWALHHFLGLEFTPFGFVFLSSASHTIVDLMYKMLWGLVFAIFFVGFMDFIPRSKFHQILGTQTGLKGLVRATLAGVVLDLCSHGILLVGTKLYERGASYGQVVAFLVASPWNSLSMTVILWSLVGIKLTLAFILLSCVVALVSGMIFESMEAKGVIPANPYKITEEDGKNDPWFDFPKNKTPLQLVGLLIQASLKDSKMILRWIFFGVILTAVIKEVLSPENFQNFFGPDMTGVMLTLLAATVIEVCSEGSAPLASELVTTAGAPGNAFTFLMAGVATDYTEIFALRETTKSWKLALLLPVITVPQILILGLFLNKVHF